jgi:undecaprenyl-diphosphatase
VIIAATSLEAFSLYIEKGFFFTNDMIIGVIVSFFTAFITITLFMKWINNASLKLFVIYRVILGILILIFYYS